MKVLVFAALVAVMGCYAVQAEEEKAMLDPQQKCEEILSGDDGLTKALIATWTLGYFSAEGKNAYEVNLDNISTALAILAERCEAAPGSSMVALLRDNTESASEQTTGTTGPGSEAEARALLTQFLSGKVDLVDLTASIVATEAEVRTVYQDELADRMLVTYAEWLAPGTSIGPKSGQTELLTWHATTDDLIAAKPILGKFPGGYKRVLPFMKPGFPIVRFKFVKPGETSGMAYDGLIYVGDRWVFMPKPWRSMPEN